MKRALPFVILCCLLVIIASVRSVSGKPTARPQEIVTPDLDVGQGMVGSGVPEKTLADTVWIASWSFDAAPGACTSAGWQRVDNYIKNDGSLYWSVATGFGGTGGISGKAAILGTTNSTCCVEPDGYGNDWYQGIRMHYSGSATLSFDYLLDSEPGFDFLEVEADSACASFSLGSCAAGVPPPPPNSASCRDVVFTDSGYKTSGHVQNQSLPDYGPGTHCVYISFFSDAGYSPCDGNQPTTLGRALVVDNIALTGSLPLSENFEGAVSPGILFLNMQDAAGFGQWGRLFLHIVDLDVCTENVSCAWLWTDYTTPTLYDPCPGTATCLAVNPRIDNSIISPWVSLASAPNASGTVLRFRSFPGNFSGISGNVASWSIRGRKLVQGLECISGWGGASRWSNLGTFRWLTQTLDMTPFFDQGSSDIAVQYRLSSWQVIVGADPPNPLVPQPGPFVDDVRIGRVVFGGPNVSEGADARSQAQDAYPTEIDPVVTPAGEHYRPTTDRFGTCAFSQGADLGINKTSPNLITGDSITIHVTDARGAGGITSVAWYGAIVAGPHAGLAPAPWSVGPNGFFAVTPDSARNASGAAVQGSWFVDLDDDYFRGGDVLHYFWLATDAQGGVTSDPVGLTGIPASPAAAQQATGGLLEVSFLPAINWSPAYLSRLRTADPGHGKVAPTAAEFAASTQRNCFLYVNHMNARRRSGDVNRTSFMYMLDRVGYRSSYDVYDHTGMGNTNNHLGGRATIQQAQGYSLIAYDAGNSTPGRPIMPNGAELDAEKIDQATWFRNWLAEAASPAVGFATLWLLGSNVVEEHPTNALYTSNCGVTLASSNQGLNVNPDVVGQSFFTFDKGSGSSTTSFTTGSRAAFSLNGGCPEIRNYDGLNASGASAVRVYRYRTPIFGASGGTLGSGAVVMNVNAAEDWNTIVMSFPWFDIRDLFDSTPPGAMPLVPPPAWDLLSAIIIGVLPASCLHNPQPTDTPEDPALSALPARTALHANVPNPFNPMTTIRFDLARNGRVSLRIYDAAGRLVRTLLDQEMEAGFQRSVVWNGMDGAGRRAPTGIYFCRLEAEGFAATQKMVLLQ